MDKRTERYRLCGGTFFTLLLQARKAPKKAAHFCLRDLLLTYDEGVKYTDENSFRTITSRFKTCEPGFRSDYIKLGSKFTFKTFEEKVKKDYDFELGGFTVFAETYLDYGSHGAWLVRALLELIENDDTISDNTKFYVKPGFHPAYKYELKEEKHFNFYNFLFGVWYYICQNCEDNGVGNLTYMSWTSDKGKSREREYVSDIGMSTYEDIIVHSEMEAIKPEKKKAIKRAMPYFAQADFDIDKVKFVPGDIMYSRREFGSEAVEDKYKLYMLNAQKRHSTHRLFLYDVEREFYKFYVCNDVRRKIVSPISINGETKEDRYEPPISDINIKKFSQSRRQFLIKGTGGLGKSMMMNHLMLDTLRYYSLYKLIPIFVTLRDYNPKKSELLDFIFEEFKRHNTDLILSDLTEIMKNGTAVVLLDGLDEIASGSRSTFNSELDRLMDQYRDCYYVASIRPGTNFGVLGRFAHFQLQPLTQDQAVDMVSKLDGGILKENSKKDFIEDLKHNRFKFDREEKRKFLGNPLFLSIMVRTYDVYHNIPTQRYIFYEQAYEAMATLHDANKSLTREFETGLTSRDFQLYFGEFCAITYEKEKYSFYQSELEDFLQDVIDFNNLSTNTEAFINDLTRKICVLYKEGTKYYFVHRSFQEYFAAYFFSKQLQQNFDAVLQLFVSRDETMGADDTLGMLYGMDPQKTELCIIIPYLERLFTEREGEDNYHSFLRVVYQSLAYEQGEVNEYADNSPALHIYRFILNTYGLACEVNGDDLPFEPDFITDEYVYIEEYWGEEGDGPSDFALCSLSELPHHMQEMIRESDEEIAGWSFEVDFMDLFENHDKYHEFILLLDLDSFALKNEYNAVKKLLAGLKEKYDKKKEVKSFISRFH